MKKRFLKLFFSSSSFHCCKLKALRPEQVELHWQTDWGTELGMVNTRTGAGKDKSPVAKGSLGVVGGEEGRDSDSGAGVSCSSEMDKSEGPKKSCEGSESQRQEVATSVSDVSGGGGRGGAEKRKLPPTDPESSLSSPKVIVFFCFLNQLHEIFIAVNHVIENFYRQNYFFPLIESGQES